MVTKSHSVERAVDASPQRVWVNPGRTFCLAVSDVEPPFAQFADGLKRAAESGPS